MLDFAQIWDVQKVGWGWHMWKVLLRSRNTHRLSRKSRWARVTFLSLETKTRKLSLFGVQLGTEQIHFHGGKENTRFGLCEVNICVDNNVETSLMCKEPICSFVKGSHFPSVMIPEKVPGSWHVDERINQKTGSALCLLSRHIEPFLTGFCWLRPPTWCRA